MMLKKRPDIDRVRGCLYGQAVGDALGLGSEFMTKEEVKACYPDGLRYYDRIVQDYHRRRWRRGAWTDDTDMMLCILTAFSDGAFDLRQVAQNFKDWAADEPLGIGSHTSKVLWMSDYVDDPEKCAKLWWDLSRQQSAANGALMRTSVVGLAPVDVEAQAAAICRLTHYDPRCVGSCVILSLMIHHLVWYDRELSFGEIRDIARRYDERIVEWIDLAQDAEEISALQLDESTSIGYTLKALAAALWCYRHAESFEAGLLAVVNEGGDADTNAAIACALLGAKFGYSSIPAYYIDHLHDRGIFDHHVGHLITLLSAE